MTTARRSRLILGGTAGLLWAATITAALRDAELKVFLVIWLATLLASLIGIARWLTRGDHGALAHARTQIEMARLRAALIEESEDRHAEGARHRHRIRSVA